MNLPAVTTSQLEYFVAALDAPTWRDAASRVGVSPSALSQGIAELERRLGITLFDRDGRRRVPTTAAAEVRRLSRANGISMPISKEVHGILYEGWDPEQSVRRLLAREQKAENPS